MSCPAKNVITKEATKLIKVSFSGLGLFFSVQLSGDIYITLVFSPTYIYKGFSHLSFQFNQERQFHGKIFSVSMVTVIPA